MFKQLYDPKTGVAYSVDGKAMIFRVTSDDLHKETRLKPYHSAVLFALFTEHPGAITYDKIKAILKEHQLVCPDETRLHRKVSELRNCLSQLHPGLEKMICNTRGIGYSLPLHLKDPESSPPVQKLRSKKLGEILVWLQESITESLALSQKCHMIRCDMGYILKRKPVHVKLEKFLEDFEKIKKQLLAEVKLHTEDFILIRIEFVLAKLKTYLGLARVSEFAITKEQWLEWHEHESMHVLEELAFLLKQAERG